MNIYHEGGEHEKERLARLECFRQTPVCFASGSQKKAEVLRRSGMFKEVISCASPGAGDREPEDHRYFLETYDDHFFALFKTEAPRVVARGKLDDMIKAGQARDDAFLLAADTMPQFFPDTDEQGKDLDTPMEAIFMERPKTKEEAKRQMMYVFTSIIRDYVDFRDFLHFHAKDMEEREQTEDKIKRTMDMMWCGRLSSCVKVNTGIAMRFPQSKEIVTFSEEINVYPHVFYDMVDQELGEVYGNLGEDHDDQTEKLLKKVEAQVAQKIDELIALQGEKVLYVNGGIDYSDPIVRACLGARISRNAQFIPEDQIDPEWFQGMPTKAIEDYIRRVVQGRQGS